MADTDIELSVGLEVQDAEKTAKQLQKQIEDIFKSRNGEQSAAITNLEIQMKKTYDLALQLQRQLDDIRNAPPVKTKQFEQIEQEYDNLSAKYEELTQKKEELLSEGAHPRTLAPLNEEIDQLGAKLDELWKQRDALWESGSAFIRPEETEEFKNIEAQLDIVSDKFKQQIIRHTEMTNREVQNYARIEAAALKAADAEARRQEKTEQAESNARARELKQGFSATTRSVMGLNMAIRGVGRLIPGVSTTAVTAVSSASRGLIRLASLTKEDMAKAILSLKSVILKALSAIMAHPLIAAAAAVLGVLIAKIIKLKKQFDQLKEVLKKVGDATLRFLRTIPARLKNLVVGVVKLSTLLEGVILKGITALIKKLGSLRTVLSRVASTLKSVVSENLRYFVLWRDGANDVNTAMSNLTSSLAYLKSALTSAFMPILTTVEPILTSLMDRLADTATNIGIFIAQLTGKNTFQRAIREQKDYAEALKGTNKQLAAFDKLNVIENGSPDKDLPVKFEEIDIEPFQLSTFEELFAKATELAEKFAEALDKINWDSIKQGARDAATGISAFLNGFIELDGLGAKIGESLAQVINTISEFFAKLFDPTDGIDFATLGSQFGDFLLNLLNGIEWDTINTGLTNLALAISNFVNAVISTEGLPEALGRTLGEVVNSISGFFDTLFDEEKGINFEKLGEAIGKFFNNAIGTIDLEKLANTLWKSVKAALRLVRGFLKTNPGTKFGKAFSEFLNHALDPKNIPWDDIKTTLNSIAENVADFLNEVITVENFSKIGDTLGEVMNTIVTAAKTFTDKVEWEQWGEAVGTAINNFFETWDLEFTAKTISQIAGKLLVGLKKCIETIKWEQVGNKIVRFIANIEWKKLGDYALSISQELRKALNTIWQQVKDDGTFEELIDVAVKFYQEYKEWERQLAKIKHDAFIAGVKAWLSNIDWAALLLEVLGGWKNPNSVWKEHGGQLPYEPSGTSRQYYNGMGGGYSRDINTGSIDDTETGGEVIDIGKDVGKTEVRVDKMLSYVKQIYDELGQHGFYNETGYNFSSRNAIGNLTLDALKALYEALGGTGYASGTVIPPTASEFLAKVGDNNHETEVISPLSTIKKALSEVMAEQNINVTFEVQGDADGMFRIIQKKANQYNQRTGTSAFA